MKKKNRPYIDLSGRVFGKLTVIEKVDSAFSGIYWRCRCECGREQDVRGSHLTGGKECCISCAMRKCATKHGLHGHIVYRIWVMMRQRCQNENAIGYKNYGGRGIKICDRWGSFENFASDVGIPPTSKHTLDRVDVNGNYEPSNFRWATPKEQQRNRRNNRHIEYNGERKIITEWSEITGISLDNIYRRLKSGWSINRTLSEPIQKYIR